MRRTSKRGSVPASKTTATMATWQPRPVAETDAMLYSFFAWIETRAPVIAFTESLFAYPVVQGVHVLALAFAVGLLGLADLRLAGVLLPRHSERAIVSALRPWFIGGFGVLLLTGLLLFLPKAT